MRFIILSFFILKGFLLFGSVDYVEVDGVNIPLLFEESRALPVVEMDLVFKNSGSMKDGKKKVGLSEISSEVFKEGTKKIGSDKFASNLEDRGISLTSNTNKENLSFKLSSLKENFPYGVNMLNSLLNDPNLKKSVLDKVKLLSIGILSSKQNNFDYIASTNLKSVIFANTPLATPTEGSKKGIDAINLKDVENFIDKHIVLNEAVIVIGGDLNLSEAKQYAKLTLEGLDTNKNVKEIGFYNASKKEETKTIKKDTQQAYIYFGSPYYIKYSDEDLYKAKVAMLILGSGGFGSRLLEEIRVKRGLAYSAYAVVDASKSHSNVSGYLQTGLENEKEAKKVVKEVVENFVKDGVTQYELDQAKKFLIGNYPLTRELLSQRLSKKFKDYYFGYEDDYEKKSLDKIKKLTLDEINDYIKEHKEISELSFSIVTK